MDLFIVRKELINILRFINSLSVMLICLKEMIQMDWMNLLLMRVLQNVISSVRVVWLMEAEIIVQHKWVKGKQCMSTQVSFKQWTSMLHFVTNAQAPYLSESHVSALIICKWHRQCRGHWWMNLGEGRSLVLFSAVCAEAPQKHYISVKLCPFISITPFLWFRSVWEH